MDQNVDQIPMEEQGTDHRPVYVVISKEDLDRICEKAVEVGTRTAVDKLKEEEKAAGMRRHDKRLHNTELLLRNYHMFKLSIEDSVYTIQQLEEENANGILQLMGDCKDPDITIESIRASKLKTAAIVAHIDKMLEVYKIYCERSYDDLDRRRYEVLIDRFISNPSLTVPEIAEKQCVSKESIYGDLKIAKERMAALIFGIDGMNTQC